MKLIEEKVYWVIIKNEYRTKEVGMLADSMEEAIKMTKDTLDPGDCIDSIEICTVPIYRKSIKTITIDI